MRLSEITPEYCEQIPENLNGGIVYISEKYGVSIHLCACGCGQKTVMPLGKDEWQLHKNADGTVSFTPSIGNFKWESPYHAHYSISNNKIEWHE